MCKQARSTVLLGNIKSMKGPPILADQDQNIHGVLITCHGKKVSSVFFFSCSLCSDQKHLLLSALSYAAQCCGCLVCIPMLLPLKRSDRLLNEFYEITLALFNVDNQDSNHRFLSIESEYTIGCEM